VTQRYRAFFKTQTVPVSLAVRSQAVIPDRPDVRIASGDSCGSAYIAMAAGSVTRQQCNRATLEEAMLIVFSGNKSSNGSNELFKKQAMMAAQ
jgi:hypothetical protein